MRHEPRRRGFQEAVDKALAINETKTHGNIKYNLEIVPGKEMPELSIIDYLIWAVQRSLLPGESRYFNALRCKYDTVINLYGEDDIKIKKLKNLFAPVPVLATPIMG